MRDVTKVPIHDLARTEQFQISVSQNGFHLFSTSGVSRSSIQWLWQVRQLFYEKFPPSEGYKIKIKLRVETVGEVFYEDMFPDAYMSLAIIKEN